jgi:hypothetical protein
LCQSFTARRTDAVRVLVILVRFLAAHIQTAPSTPPPHGAPRDARSQMPTSWEASTVPGGGAGEDHETALPPTREAIQKLLAVAPRYGIPI